MSLSHSRRVAIGPGTGDDIGVERPDLVSDRRSVRVDEKRAVGIVGFAVMAAEVDFLHPVERERVQIGPRIGAVVLGRDEHVVDVEQQPAAGPPRQLGEKVDLGDRAFGEPHIGGRIFQQHHAAERRLHRVDMLGDARQSLGRIRQRQKIVEIDAAVRRPGEMLGEALRLVARAEDLEPREMLTIERRGRSDRQADAVNRQRIAFAERAELRMRRSAGAHIVLRVHLEEADRLRRCEDVAKMRRLETDAGARRETGRDRHAAPLFARE